MSLLDWVHFCLGDAAAIERLAGNPWTVVIGALLVFSAGLARNYDVHDLVRQSWRLLVPFAASTLAAALLYGVLWLIASDSLLGRLPPWSLLGLFWLTAPLAWLYGLPYERIWPKEGTWQTPVAADRRRAALLIVSLARVAIMTRCVVVLGRADVGVSLAIVTGFLVPMAVLALMLTAALVRDPEERRPATPSKELQRAAAKLQDGMAMIPRDDVPMPPVQRRPGALEATGGLHVEPWAALGCGGVLLILAAFILSAVFLNNRWQPVSLEVAAEPPTLSCWAFALGGNGCWLGLALWRQPAQRRRTRFVERLQMGPLEETLGEVDRRRPGDFPPQWDPSGVLARQPYLSRLLDAVIIAHRLPEESWVRQRFAARIESVLPHFFDRWEIWLTQDNRASDAQLGDLERLYDFLVSSPNGAALLVRQREYLHELASFLDAHDPPRAAILRRILALAGDAV